ncbi:MAG TPA: ABC transporter substrate-binding protein [Actinomadura sp.]|jgi:NitT/TauT family transport system substrate-binding protein|nr:ABC transporter substrate-binding protein [Actinomadura sp.]
MKLRWTCAAAATALLLSTIAGCGGSDSAKSKGGLEKAEIKVGVLPIVDDAPLYLALKNKYFEAEGLKVTPVFLANGVEAIGRLQSGGVDLAWSSYPGVINSAAKGLKLRVVLDGYAAKPHLFSVMALPSAAVKKPTDLVGKKVAVNSLKGLGPLLLSSALKTAGVDPRKVQMIELPFANMPAALQNKAVDAAWVTEPFRSESQQKLGVVEAMDTATGPTESLPIAGFISAGSFPDKNPKTLAAFQRAMVKAQTLAADRSQVEQILPTYIKTITPELAATITMGSYPTGSSQVRLQRVADLMHQFGQLDKPFDVKPVLQK